MANVLFKRGNTATINGTAVTDGQLLYNTTTGQHYIDSDLTRKEVGKPVANTTAEVSAITVDNISCGTKPVKELISNLPKCHINSDANIEMLYFKWAGDVIGGQTVEFGSFYDSIPAGKTLVGLFLTPKCTVHISMSYYDYNVYAYSESFTGKIYYDALMIVS